MVTVEVNQLGSSVADDCILKVTKMESKLVLTLSLQTFEQKTSRFVTSSGDVMFNLL